MLKSLKFRFIFVLIFILLGIASLAITQQSFSQKIENLHDAQLALKELQIKHMQMELAKINYLYSGDEKYAKDLEVYANTMEIYLEIVDEYLVEFSYPQSLEDNIEKYLTLFEGLHKSKEFHTKQNIEELNSHAKKISLYIEDEKSRLTPIISAKIEKIQSISNIIYFTISVLSIVLLIVSFNPIIRSISILKDFFSHYKNSKDRLDLDTLYFSELKGIATSVNEMLDIQENAKKEIITAKNEALNSQKVKDEFLSNMSHELRTPLNAIGGFSGVLLRKLPHEHAIINPILDSSAHLLQLVSDILDLSKIQSGKFHIVEEPFGLYEELLSFKERFMPLVNKKSIELTLNYDGSKNIDLLGDWFRISQILNNFMSNAIKFTPEGGKIEFQVSYKDGILFAGVQDSGIGIKEESLQNILKPFEQSDDKVAKKFGGTGLGLSIATTLTDMMGGSFNIESKIDVGSTFSVTLPLEQTQRKVEEVEIEEAGSDEVSIGAHVLIAEDNKTNQLLLSMLLEDIEITFDIANDGQEAFEMFKEDVYDMILMDENMPKMNGTESMLKIREQFINVPPIIAVTANAMKGDKQRLLKIGMDDFLSKPIDNDLLIKVIKRNLK